MNKVNEVFSAVANVAGGVIKDGKFEEKTTEKVTKKKVDHESSNFYCLAVPGKSFFIKSNDKVSVTGNTLHAESMIKLFRQFVQENKKIWNDELKSEIYQIATKMVELEDKFVELAYEMGDMPGLTQEEVKQYIRYIADRRLISLGMKGIFKVKKNPLPWVDGMLGVTHSNFFEQKVTDYAKGALTGDWGDVWAE